MTESQDDNYIVAAARSDGTGAGDTSMTKRKTKQVATTWDQRILILYLETRAVDHYGREAYEECSVGRLPTRAVR